MQTLINWLLVVIPSLIYPCLVLFYRRILKYKQLEIEALMSRGNVLKRYVDAFTTADQKPVDRLIHLHYALTNYGLPVLVNMAVTTLGTLLCTIRLGVPLGLSPEMVTLLKATPDAVLAGLTGAYLWGMYGIIQRYRSVDLSAVSMHDMWLRMIIAASIGWLIGKSVQPPLDLWAAFGIGAFPLQTLIEFVKSQTGRQFTLADAAKAEPPTVYLVQGATSPVIERLSEEGLTSIEHLAYADPIKLLLKTNLEWKMILDLIDQSILLTYIDEKASSIRADGIRGAIELSKIGSPQNVGETPQEAEKMLEIIASKLGIEPTGLKSLIRTLERDPQVGLISTLWGEAFGPQTNRDAHITGAGNGEDIGRLTPAPQPAANITH